LRYTVAPTATINSTRRTTAIGANNTVQRLAEETGLMAGGLVEAEGTGLPGKLAEAAVGMEVLPMKACMRYCNTATLNNKLPSNGSFT